MWRWWNIYRPVRRTKQWVLSSPERCGVGMGEPMKKRQLKQSVVGEEQNLSITAESDPDFPLES